MSDDPDAIYLQAPCCSVDEAEGRLWCEDEDPVRCDEAECRDAGRGLPTKYVRADLHDDLRTRLQRAEELLKEAKPAVAHMSFDKKLFNRIDAFLGEQP